MQNFPALFSTPLSCKALRAFSAHWPVSMQRLAPCVRRTALPLRRVLRWKLSTGTDSRVSDMWAQDMLQYLPYKRASFAMEDARSLTAQLGYTPYNIIDVVARNDSGQPIVALLYGLTKGKTAASKPTKSLRPFPTIYWLTCPALKNNISTLEYSGWVAKLQERLNADPAHIAAMQRAHELYSEERRSNLSAEDLAFLENNKSLHEYHTYGVAGMKSTSFRCVKCLHCHYAHFMGNPGHGNIIGKWVSELLLHEDDKLAEI